MTQPSIETRLLRVQAQLGALEMLVVTIIRATRSVSPDFAELLRLSLGKVQESVAQVRIPGAPAELSDLAAQEFQEAWGHLLQQVQPAPS